jgi:hypothetical protein
LTHSSTDKANKKISLAITNSSVGTNTYTITVRITDSFNFSRDYVKNVSFIQFPTDSLIPQLSINSNRKVSINPTTYGFGLSYSWMVKQNHQNGSAISFTRGTTREITISNGTNVTYAIIYVKCIVTYTSSSSTGNVTKSFEREVTIPVPTLSITGVTQLSNRRVNITISASNYHNSYSISAASMQSTTRISSLQFQFSENETGGNKNISVTIQDSRGYTATASKNDYYLNITFEYSPTLQFVANQTRLLKLTDNTILDDILESNFEYAWSASSGITLDSSGSQVDREFKNYVVQDSVAGTVYVDVTQINVDGFKKDYSYSIEIPLPEQTQVFVSSFTITGSDNTVGAEAIVSVSSSSIISIFYSNIVNISLSESVNDSENDYQVSNGSNTFDIMETLQTATYYLWIKSANKYSFTQSKYTNKYVPILRTIQKKPPRIEKTERHLYSNPIEIKVYWYSLGGENYVDFNSGEYGESRWKNHFTTINYKIYAIYSAASVMVNVPNDLGPKSSFAEYENQLGANWEEIPVPSDISSPGSYVLNHEFRYVGTWYIRLIKATIEHGMAVSNYISTTA